MSRKSGFLRRAILLTISFSLVFQQAGFSQVASGIGFPAVRNPQAPVFRPLHLRFFSYNTTSDQFRMLLDKGDLKELKGRELELASGRLLNYFLIGVTLPDEVFWVNLRPDSAGNILDDDLAKTDIGKVLLEADVQLKKDTAAFTSPSTAEGRQYWDRLYKKAEEIYGDTQITLPTLTRPWIVPNEIILRESGDSAYICKATLKVLLEQDRLKGSPVYGFKDERERVLNEYSSQLIRELIIPRLTREVNSARRYAELRQVYYSLILARWFKGKFRGQAGAYSSRIDTKDLSGLVSPQSWSRETYYDQYRKSFREGEYSIGEVSQGASGQKIRNYVSGGINVGEITVSGYQSGNPAFEYVLEETLTGFAGTPGGALNEISPVVLPDGGDQTPAVHEEKRQWITPEEASGRLRKLPTIGDMKTLKAYYETAKDRKPAYTDVLKDLSAELSVMADILKNTRQQDELNALVDQGVRIEELDILRAESEFILQFVQEREGVDNPAQLKYIKEVFVKYPQISRLLVRYFKTKFNPRQETVARGKAAYGLRLEALKEIEQVKDNRERRVFRLAIGMMMATTKTDYYLENRTELSFRLDPRTLQGQDHLGIMGYAPPFALIWVHVPYGVFGAHSRYANIARGGLRALNPKRTQLMNKVFAECVALSLVQHRKHSKIPEGGSKGTYMTAPGLNPVAAAVGYVDGLINMMISSEDIVIASGGQAIDPLELGPDEGTSDIGTLASVRAWMKGLKDWRLLMTGRIGEIFGTQHDKNDLLTPPRKGNRVTSQGVMQHAFELVRFLREAGKIKSKDGEPLAFAVTGGLDGDVGSGIIENAIHLYGENAKILCFNDLMSVVFDPEGLDHDVILEMYGRKSLGTEFPREKLHKGGFVVEVKEGSGEDSYVVLGTETLSHMNTRAFEPGLLEEYKADAVFRTQAKLQADQPLVTVLERDADNHPSKIRVHSSYLRDVIFFVTRADMFVPGGGLRNAMNDANWQLFLDWEGKPSAPAIVYGANVFSTDQANIGLEKAGVIIEPDFMANSVGVETSSRMEIDFNTLFREKEITPELMREYFGQVLAKFLHNARRDVWTLRIEAQDHPEQSVVTEVAPGMSDEIIRLAEAITFSRLVGDREASYSDEILGYLREYFPDVSGSDPSYGNTLKRVFDRMPAERIKLIVSKVIAREAVFNLGMGIVSPLGRQYGKSDVEVIGAYLKAVKTLKTRYKHLDSLIARIINNDRNIAPRHQIAALRHWRREVRENVEEILASSPVKDGGQDILSGKGGIDFRAMNILARPVGSFSGIDCMLPRISNIESFNLDRELRQITTMVKAGIVPSDERLRECVAACFQKQEFASHAGELIACLADICKLQEINGSKTGRGLKELLVIVDQALPL